MNNEATAMSIPHKITKVSTPEQAEARRQWEERLEELRLFPESTILHDLPMPKLKMFSLPDGTAKALSQEQIKKIKQHNQAKIKEWSNKFKEITNLNL